MSRYEGKIIISRKSTRLFGSDEEVGEISIMDDGMTWIVYKHAPKGLFSSKEELGKITCYDKSSYKPSCEAYLKTDRFLFSYKKIDISKLYECYDLDKEYSNRNGSRYAKFGPIHGAEGYVYDVEYSDFSDFLCDFNSTVFSYALSLLIHRY